MFNKNKGDVMKCEYWWGLWGVMLGCLIPVGILLFIEPHNSSDLELIAELKAKVSNQRKELATKEQRVADLKHTNKILDTLILRQKRLIEGEGLGEFMEMFERNEEGVTSIEVLVRLEDSETGLPMRFLLKGCVDDDQKEEEL